MTTASPDWIILTNYNSFLFCFFFHQGMASRPGLPVDTVQYRISPLSQRLEGRYFAHCKMLNERREMGEIQDLNVFVGVFRVPYIK